jgi:hypothetical protein
LQNGGVRRVANKHAGRAHQHVLGSSARALASRAKDERRLALGILTNEVEQSIV